jgi:acetyltransferase-like isoleucine patch superfamily enzyme
MLRLLIRKTISFFRRVSDKIFSDLRRRIAVYANTGVQIDSSCLIREGVKIVCTDGGKLKIGTNTDIGRNVELVVRGGCLIIGNNVCLGVGSVLVSSLEIHVGDDTLIAEYVVIRDQDHEIQPRPIRRNGSVKSPIKIGSDCWLGAKVTVLRGSTIGNGAVIGAHSLVRGEVDAFSLAVGTPAKVVKQFLI